MTSEELNSEKDHNRRLEPATSEQVHADELQFNKSEPDSLHQGEDEEHQQRIKELEDRPTDWLHARAHDVGIPEWSQLQREALIHRLADSASSPAH